ncbi:MAG: pyridoxamine 5'-phosphate oxidase [Planctomycetota bacterium]
MDLNDLRQEYSSRVLDESNADPCPFKQFESWFEEATTAGILEPNAMVLATSGSTGTPAARSVLLKNFDESGFVFFTNYGSRKATHIAESPSVSALFPWYALQRQIEISGVAVKISVEESEKYFALRPRGSQLGAWASEQSSTVSSRQVLQEGLDSVTQKFEGADVPMPPFWGGFRIEPVRIEFWQGGAKRLHDRIVYVRENREDPAWVIKRLSP